MEWQGLMILLGAYLLGSVPFGLVIAHLTGAGDIRQKGSGNIGATNVLRTVGRTAGALTLVLDMAKGGGAAWFALHWGPPLPWVPPLTALAVFGGHLWPIWLGFQGGKGVATGIGVMLAWNPLAALAMISVWLVTAWWSRRSSLAALVAYAVLPAMLAWLGDLQVMVTASVMTMLVFWRHQPNIRRLVEGSEPRIGQKD
jgi:glycerol-3-phosphate acyltransferase PlsY